jgi:PST family polysaccharide transporter
VRDSPHFRSMLTNLSWLSLDKILRLGGGLIVNVWVARFFGPELFGVYSYAIAFVGLFASFVVLGLDSIVIRDMVKDPSCTEETLGTAFAMKASGAAISIVLAIGIVLLLRPEDQQTHWLVVIIAFGTLFQAFDVIDLWFQSQVQSKFTVFAKNSAFLALSLVKIGCILARAPLIAFAAAGSAEIALGAFGLVTVYHRKGFSIRRWRASSSRARSLLNDSWPLILADLAIFIQAKIDQIMLGQMLGNKEVGLYAAATRIAEVFNFIPIVIYSSVYPIIVGSKQENPDLYARRMTDLYRVMFIVTLAVGIPVSLLSEPAVHLLYGNAYAGVGTVLSLFIWSRFFTNFGVARSIFIATENLFRYSLFCAVVGTAVNIAANYLLIPHYGIIGSIIATNVSFTLTIFVIDGLYPRTRANFLLMVKGIGTFFRISL